MWKTDWEQLKKHPGYRPVDRKLRSSCSTTLKGTGGGRSLLLNGHTDVNPVDVAKAGRQSWSRHRSRTGASTVCGSAT